MEETAVKNHCCICNTSEKELKPIGPARAWICRDCSTSDPERAAIGEMYERQEREARANQLREALESMFVGARVMVLDLPIDALTVLGAEPCGTCPACVANAARKQNAN